MAENGTVDTIRTTPPSPTTSPSSPHNYKLASAAMDNAETNIAGKDGQQGRLLGSPHCNGYGGMSPNSKDNDNVKNSNCLTSPPPEARAKSEGGMVDVHCRSGQPSGKRQSEQDGPLDFSLRRRDSVSETFTDDSRASSSLSPPGSVVLGQPRTTPPSSRLSPESESAHHYAGLARLHDSHARSRPSSARSGGASPDDTGSIGQPRIAPHAGSRSPGGMSLGSMGLLQDGSPSNPTSVAAAVFGGNGSMLGPLGNLSAFMADPRRVQGTNGGKVQRPFKAYPKEALQMPLGYLGLPGMNPFSGVEQGMSVSQEELMNIYKQQLDFLKERDKQLVSISKMMSGSSATRSTSSPTAASNGSSNSSSIARQPSPGHTSAPHHPTSTPSPYFPHASPPTNTPHPSTPSNSYSPGAHNHLSNTPFPPPTAPPLVSSTSSMSGGSSRKRPRVLPDNQKDQAYWERRRKNNDAAKRSRDARRAKEDEIAIRAALLEQENLKLRVEVAALKTETARLRCMLYNS